MYTQTIAAIATALNNAGISIIRISGDEALDIIYKIFRPKNTKKDIRKVKTHTLHYGYIIYGEDTIDEVLVAVMKAPNSYTMEDVVEINCHGGIVVTKKILDVVFNNGARPAEPGEFTKRAFLNGRIDLSQAEAVMDVISARNEYALKSSLSQLKGNIKEKIMEIRKTVMHDIAFIEAAIDDPEHIDIDGYSKILRDNTNESIDRLNRLYNSADNGRIIKEGIDTVIVGKPNAGKSSLLNVLVGDDRAIVTDIAGTTRDILREEINLNGILLNVIDTAGIRDTADVVEQIGVNKAKDYIDNCDLIIYVIDASTKLDENDKQIISLIKDKKSIILLNKSDLEQKTTLDDLNMFDKANVIQISAKIGAGLNELEDKIKSMFFNGMIKYNDEVIITNMRQKNAIKDAVDSLNKVIESIDNDMPEDFYSIDMMSAYQSLSLVVGEAVEDDLVDTIFREFCMGK